MKVFDHIGSEEIRLAIAGCPEGTVIKSVADLKNWIGDTCNRQTINSRLLVATFVIDLDGNLRLADRRAEHVACARRSSRIIGW